MKLILLLYVVDELLRWLVQSATAAVFLSFPFPLYASFLTIPLAVAAQSIHRHLSPGSTCTFYSLLSLCASIELVKQLPAFLGIYRMDVYMFRLDESRSVRFAL